MKRTFNHFMFMIVFVCTTTIAMAQTVTGTVVDGDGQPLPGANIQEVGTSNGTTSDIEGNFSLTPESNSGTIEVSFVGFETVNVKFSGSQNLGTISLAAGEMLGATVLTGVIDLAIDRKTPVAVSTIRAADIANLGNREFPEILEKTPSIYTTRSGGGYGDARINVRGFNQRNVAVMINGVPVNDMENGWVYWSNWAGLSDVAQAVQVQRGLGASKLAIASVGGTINVVTKATEDTQGGFVKFETGNNGFFKQTAKLSTGKSAKGWGFTTLLSHAAGDGYINGTKFEGWNYFFALGFSPEGSKHEFQLIATGAPQTHFQRGFANSLSDYQKYGRKYNSDYGYLDGEMRTFSGNFYHKPVASFNWDWEMSERSKLSTVLYASWGRGGSIGSIGRPLGNASYTSTWKTSDGLVDFNKIRDYNTGIPVEIRGNTVQRSLTNGQYLTKSDDSYNRDEFTGIASRNSMNSHNWYGAISNFNTNLTDALTLNFGIDLRTYKGVHYRRLNDLLGSGGYLMTKGDDINNIGSVNYSTYDARALLNVFKSTDKEKKIDYYNDGKVGWAGAFSQLEYSNDAVSAFLSGSISSQRYQRIDYFAYTPAEQKSEKVKQLGGTVKGGLNYNINDKNNVYGNMGFYSKQPLFDAVFLNFGNTVNQNLKNEKILAFEIGYGFKSSAFDVKLNAYNTSWKDRFISTNGRFTDSNGVTTNFLGEYSGVQEVHRGIELETNYRALEKLTLNGMLSVNDWRYKGNVNATYYDENQNPLTQADLDKYGFSSTLYLDKVEVGDAAQLTASAGLKYELFNNFDFDTSWLWANEVYADFNPSSFSKEGSKAIKLPHYNLFNAGLTYSLDLERAKNFMVLRFGVNNLFNTQYLAELDTNYEVSDPTNTVRGLDPSNRGFWGFGRTWNLSARFNF